MTPRRRAVMDVSTLPKTVFGPRDLMWWGTTAFMVIEGFTLVLCAVVYVYLRKNFATWPPEGLLRPAWEVPTLQAILMLGSLVLVGWLAGRARDKDFTSCRLGLTMAAGVCTVFVALRVWELTRSLNVRWDANAYGSALWLIVGAHGTLVAIQWLEVTGAAAMFWRGPIEKKHFTDVADIAYYWWFIVLSWIPLYVLCYLLPYWV